MIKYAKGNVFDSGADIIAHGVNCVGGFGSGVAGQISKKYPIVRDCYLGKYDSEGWKLGDVQFISYKTVGLSCISLYIANCATQKEFYPRDRVHADYEAIRTCMTKVKEFAKTHDLTVAMPKIGAGLAGGDWNVIEKIVEEVFADYNVAVYCLE